MASKEVMIEIKGDATDIVKKAEQASGAMAGIAKTTKNMFSLQILQQAGSMLSGIFSRMSEFVSLYEAQRTQEGKLLALMKNRNDFSQKMYTQHLAFARKLQESTNYGDEQILDVMSQFQTFGNISQDMVQKVTQATLNIAQTTGQSAVSVAIQVAKAMSEPVKMASALRRSGIMFDENKLKSLGTLAQQQAYLMQEINSQYGGAAQGAQSELKKFQNILGDIKEEIGRALLPLFASFAKGLLIIMQAVSGVINWFDKLFGVTTDIAHATKELDVAIEKHNQDMSDISSTENMISKYEELAAKTNRTAAEQKQLSDITQQLAQKMPSAITAFDQYGKAISIAAKEARNLVKEQKQIAQEALEAQTENTLSQAQKALNNLRKARAYINQNSTQRGISDFGGAILSSIPGLNAFTDTSQGDAEARNKTFQEMQKLIPQYDSLYDAVLRTRNLEESHVKTMYELAKAAGKTRLSYAAYRAEMEAAQSVHNGMIRQYGNLYSGLSRESQEQARLAAGFGTEEQNREVMRNLARQEQARRNASTQGQSAAKAWLQALEALREYASKLNEVNLTEFEVKIKANFDEFEKTMKKLMGETLAKRYSEALQNALSMGGAESEVIILDVVKNIAINAKRPIDEIASMVDNIRKKIHKQTQESIQETNNLIRQFTEDSEKLSSQLGEIERQRLELIKKIQQSGKRSIEQKQKDIAKVNEAAEQKRTTATLKSIKSAVEGVKDAFEGMKTGIKGLNSGTVAGIAGGVSTVSSSISGALDKFGVSKAPIIGGIISAVGGLVGGVASLFESEGETAQEIWQRLFDLTQAKYNYELAKEKELQTQIQKRMELYSYLEKIYGENSEKAYEAQKKLLEENIDMIIEKFSKKGSVTLGGLSYDVSDIVNLAPEQKEELLSAMKREEAKYSEVARTEVQLAAQELRNALAGGSSIGMERAVREGDMEHYYMKAYKKWEQAIRATGFTDWLYSPWDFLDESGNDGGQGVQDISQNMQMWASYFENAAASADALSGDLETYLDQTAELVSLEEARVDAASDLLDIQRKLSDELIKQLKSLNNISINNLLQQLDELEFQVQTGAISESQALNQRQNIMTAIANILGQTGQTGLQNAVISQRASYLSEADQEKFLKMSGLGNVVTFAKGGYTGSDNALRLVGAGETVLNPAVTQLLSRQMGVSPQRLQDVLAAGAMSGNLMGLTMNNVFNGIPSDTNFNDLENKIYSTVERAYRRLGVRI